MLPVQEQMRAAANPPQAEFLKRFFKTGPGQYAEGDLFLGLKVPQTRGFLKICRDYSLKEVLSMLQSPYHEERLLALMEMGRRARREPQAILDAYLAHIRWVNNWDLVDGSAPQIVGETLLGAQDRSLLDLLAASDNLWERRIAVVSTLALIRKGQIGDTLRLCQGLLHEHHDLMHKACGWMLREVGKRSLPALLGFLDEHAALMPRTMLRYSLEKLSVEQRAVYLAMGRPRPKT
ncbi:DNA alkylation repair protein [bacterium]|nr:DNA alkylation repair protein [bacterium]